jgi:outer membrane lipoprotein-sorting protein
MNRTRRTARRRVAWTVPLATVAVVGGAIAVPLSASAGPPDLDGISPESLLAAVRTADVQHLSGEVAETARLGLPQVAGQSGDASLSWQALVTGTNTARVAVDGSDRQRLAVLGTLAESDVVHNGSDVWTYASSSNEVDHVVLAADLADRAAVPQGLADPMAMTPLGAAQYVLGAVTPTTAVSMAENTRVAGQDAYSLVLTPVQAGSTISRVVIAVDATRHIPLQVQVFNASTSDAVFETGFTSISYDRPSAATFDFAVPAGATVTTHQAADGMAAGVPGQAPAQVLGSGWTSVVEYTPDAEARAAMAPQALADSSSAEMLSRLVTELPNGDRLLSTALVNVLQTADGRVLTGAVEPSVLQQAASTR